MSTYYYFYKENKGEYFELCSGSWYNYMEGLQEILKGCKRVRKSYKAFIKKLRSSKLFKYFYDDDEDFITSDTERYFLRPLFDWYEGDVRLINDGDLYDMAIQKMCDDKGIKYETKNWYEYSDEIEKNIDEYVIDKYLKRVGKLFYEKEDMARIGVSFEQAIAELKAGSVIFRKSNPEQRWWIENGKLEWTYGDDCTDPIFDGNDLLAEDWSYENE